MAVRDLNKRFKQGSALRANEGQCGSHIGVQQLKAHLTPEGFVANITPVGHWGSRDATCSKWSLSV
jgi:hypothetical protein